jgi:hypothetical protein
MAGLFLVGLGVVVLGVARKREEIERMRWPDEA